MDLADGQGGYRVRFEWGPVGADAVAPGAAFVAVVDVLSFTTTLTVAIEQGLHVLPYRWRDDSAVDVARRHGAMLAVLRKEAGPGQVTLSPESILHANLRAEGIDRLVLPSPNGSAISVRLADAGVTVVGVSLRNAAAAAAWVRERAGDRPIGVVASGERWPDGSLRPAIEDLLGAGAFLHGLADGSGAGFSPEADAAMWAYRGVADGLRGAEGLGGALHESVSGRELRGFGFEGDVAVASAVGVSSAVPVLRDGWFVDGGSFAVV
ncbi:2-phosphosulfolactate phosphatase [Actinoplanes subtropicus]|uniref:2-phosphosulfolactate phosphatase n=1 Tax=Actinoplanes subtropicus TaxID=543632 RepID=UPI0005525068|nr:2-phosphosulfolactate phosphatase [Actinoplanes subtropicus]